jgi:hypothetical protein
LETRSDFNSAINELNRISDKSRYHRTFRDLYLGKLLLASRNDGAKLFIETLAKKEGPGVAGSESEYFSKYLAYLHAVATGDAQRANGIHQDLSIMPASRLVERCLRSFALPPMTMSAKGTARFSR